LRDFKVNETFDVVILGGGTAGWMAAAGLVSFLPPGRCRIRLVESEEIGTVGVGEATLPQLKGFNEGVGVDEAEMMRATNATFKLGIQFVDWGCQGSRYIHPFGLHGPPGSGHAFRHRWVRALRHGLKSDIQEFSLAVMAAEGNRFDFPDRRKTALKSTFDYAYHFDASLYAAYLRALAEQRGAIRIEGKVADVEQDPANGDIRALVLESGQRIEGDFFIDCSGFRSLLLGSRLGVGWEDWSKWLPCDRALAVPTGRATDFSPYTRSTAMEAGWRWRIPLQHRTGNGYVFSSAFTDEAHAAEALLASLEGPAMAEPRLLKFQAGRRIENWARNCVALGLASGFLEPLESTSIYLIQIAIMHLIPLFPTSRSIDPRLRREFNRKIDLEYERIRDFLILHYHLNERDDAEIWRYCRNMEVPDSLKRKIALFRHSGIIEEYKDGLFTPPSWLSVLHGQGLVPDQYHPAADGEPEGRLISELEELRTEIRDQVDEMPSHERFVARYCEANVPFELVRAEARL
jgi:tryptophan halogenase